MREGKSLSGWAFAVLSAALLAWPAVGGAQSVVGRAAAADVSTFGLLGGTTTVADTGALAGAGDARDASQVTGGVPSILSGEVLDAVTLGWPDQVVSQASLASLGLRVAGVDVAADFVQATATAPLRAGARGTSVVRNLSVNGVPIVVTGAPNQVVPVAGGQVVINEQRLSPDGALVVTGVHAVVSGVAAVAVASATAGIR